jgi:hypothetical protein
MAKANHTMLRLLMSPWRKCLVGTFAKGSK